MLQHEEIDYRIMQDVVDSLERIWAPHAVHGRAMAPRSKMSEEFEAIQKVIEIISSEAVSGNAELYFPTLLQKSSSLTQVQTEEQSARRAWAMKYLQIRGKQLNSRVLYTRCTHD